MEPWIKLNMQLVAEQAKNPPLAARGYGLVSTAMHDAAIATWHWKYVYRRDPPPGSPVVPPGPDPSYPSEHAAIAGAASRVLAYLFPERPEASYDEMADEAAQSVVAAGTNFRSDAKAGLDLGRAVADAVIARGQADGSQDHGSLNRPVGVGSWEAPPEYRMPDGSQLIRLENFFVTLNSDLEIRMSPLPPRKPPRRSLGPASRTWRRSRPRWAP